MISYIRMIWIILIVSFALATAKTYVDPEHLQQLRDEGNDEEFAKLLGIDVKLVRPNNDQRSEGSIFNKASPLGDILLTKEQEEQARQGIRFDRYPDSRWKNGEIPYRISNDFTPEQKQIIEGAIADFNQKVDKVKLVRRRSIFFPQRDYIMVFSGEGCYSYIGRIGGQQALSLQSNGCVYKGTVQHEFMHAAGFTHEHNRPDRDNYIRIIEDNIPEEWRSQYEKGSDQDFGNVKEYDYYSVMHYPVLSPGSGLPAYEVLQSGINEDIIGQGDELTDTDIDKLNTQYA